MKLGSLFDGSGGFPLAGALCGIEPMWAAEVEPYPIAVTRSRFPNMKHLGDISKVHGGEIEPVDIISFGSPCQDLSVAGKRAGLKHEANGDEETTRSGLFMEAVRIIKEMREKTNGLYPTFAIWENVPGAFSSNNGEDFRIVCEELIKIVEPSAFMPSVPKGGWNYADSFIGDGWSLAYRVFDAQYWGVPQRRRRIYLVADFAGGRAQEILFEREGLRGYFAEGRTPWQEAPINAKGGIGADDREGEGFDGYNGDLTGDKSSTLGVNCGIPTGRNGVIERRRQLDAVAYSFDSLASNSMKSANPHSGCREVEVSKTLDTTDPNPSKNQGGIAVVQPIPYLLKIRSGCEGGGKGALIQEDKSATLATNNDQYLFQPVVAYSIENHPADSRVNIDDSGKVQTLTSRMGTGGGNVPMVKEAVCYDGAGITSPINASNPMPGDPCHTLGTDSRNYAVICLQGNGIDRADTAGCNGKGWKEDTSYTLNTIDRPAVVYAVDQGGGKSSANVSENTAPTLCTTHGGEPAVAYTEEARTLHNNTYASTLMARDYKGVGRWDTLGSVVSVPTGTNYIVRRLTPTECARLQGFADWWGVVEPKDTLTDEEYRFWLDARNTHARINGKTEQDYTAKQMLTWYNKLWTDSAEYKMWGNGIALPCALYVMQGIAEAHNDLRTSSNRGA